ncbi:cytochrome-c peroxidase, partial [Klebsiella pneumoniae]|nr:cytochrome-c peroxidase [Klebsiella pneumoniae]
MRLWMHCRAVVVLALLSLPALPAAIPGTADAAALTPLEQLGKSLFFDANLSRNRNQSCATCHAPAVGFT